MKLKKAVSLVLAGLLIASAAACSAPSGGSSASSAAGTSATTEKFKYPMDGSTTVTWWSAANSSQTGNQQERKNNPYMIWLQEKTGVKIEFQHPPIGEEKNSFNILCASSAMPDIISYDVNSYTGGMQQAVDDGVALKLNDYLPKYCPNLQAVMDENNFIKKNLATTNGDYCFFPTLTLDPYTCSWFGWQIRADWLKEQGLSAPVTMGDWYNCLTKLKKAYNLESALIIRKDVWSQGEMATAFKTALTYDINDKGEVVFGPSTQEYKAFLTEMNKWFREGLLSPDFATMDDQTAKATYNSGKCAAIVDSVGSMTGFISSGQKIDPDFATMGTTYPVMTKGETPYRGYRNLSGISRNSFISGDIASNKIEAACRLLDYGYSEEGRVFENFGKEGESFTYVNGKPVYTDLVMKNPDGLDKNTAIRLYTNAAGPQGEQMKEYMEQNNNLDCQKEAINNWMKNDQEKHAYPDFAKGTTEQEQRLAVLNTDISTYVDEMRVKFIMGTEDLANFDNYVKNLKNIGMDEALQLKKGIYEKYEADLNA